MFTESWSPDQLMQKAYLTMSMKLSIHESNIGILNYQTDYVSAE